MLKQVSSIKGHDKEVWSVCWSNKGDLLSSCSSDCSAKIWKNNKEICNLSKHSRTTRYSDFSVDDKFLAVSSFDGTVSIYKFDENTEKYIFTTFIEGQKNEVKSVSWDRNSKLIATSSRNKTIWIWEQIDDDEFDCNSVLNKHTQDVKFVKFHPTFKNKLFSCSFDDTIMIFGEDDEDFQCEQTLEEHSSTVWSFDFHKSGNFFVSAGNDKSLIFWKYFTTDKKWKKIYQIKNASRRTIFSVSWSKVNDLIAIAENNNIRIFMLKPEFKSINEENIEFEEIYCLEKAHEFDVNCVMWHPKEKILASCGDDKFIKVWKFIKR